VAQLHERYVVVVVVVMMMMMMMMMTATTTNHMYLCFAKGILVGACRMEIF